jgi:hypothetical protein
MNTLEISTTEMNKISYPIEAKNGKSDNEFSFLLTAIGLSFSLLSLYVMLKKTEKPISIKKIDKNE